MTSKGAVMKINEWWNRASRGKRAAFLIVVLIVLVAVVNAIVHHSGSSSGSGGGSTSGFTASCFITSAPVIGDQVPEVTFNNPTPNDESVVGGEVTVILFDQNGDQIGTDSVSAPVVIAANQSVTTGTDDADDAPTGAASCSVAPYQTTP
jgi:hypothetical protein